MSQVVERNAVRSSAEWVAYLQANAARRLDVPWEAGPELTADERAMIAASLAAWQLGETSDGSHLLAAARRYADQTGDPEFIDAVRLFIGEEQRHGAELGRFLDLEGIPRKRWDWGDAAFRALRYLIPHIEMWATPVVLVETHAMIYYAAVRRATRSEVLRRVCEQILTDEVPHIRFQCERLAVLHHRRSRLLYIVTMAGHRLFFTGITLAVWVGHRRALRAGGFTFGRFWRAAWARAGSAWRKMDPRAYRWAATDGTASNVPTPTVSSRNATV